MKHPAPSVHTVALSVGRPPGQSRAGVKATSKGEQERALVKRELCFGCSRGPEALSQAGIFPAALGTPSHRTQSGDA